MQAVFCISLTIRYEPTDIQRRNIFSADMTFLITHRDYSSPKMYNAIVHIFTATHMPNKNHYTSICLAAFTVAATFPKQQDPCGLFTSQPQRPALMCALIDDTAVL